MSYIIIIYWHYYQYVFHLAILKLQQQQKLSLIVSIDSKGRGIENVESYTKFFCGKLNFDFQKISNYSKENGLK